jgi:diguanylate cyclase (GGDEF)-like protein/PAS domain S-box-containing protein
MTRQKKAWRGGFQAQAQAAVEPAALAGVEPATGADFKSAADRDVSMLIRALREADRRLDELTAGEVDTVADSEGRPFMLQRAQDGWRRSGADKQAAILDALSAQVVLLDGLGVILSTNEAWRQFADTNALPDPNYLIGSNYLAVCDAASGEGASDAAFVAYGIRSVLARSAVNFSHEYRCDSPTETRWFALTATRVGPVGGEALSGVVVMHLDVTERKRVEEDASRFAAAMDASPDSIVLVDRVSMRFVHVNDAACLMHCRSREEVLALRPWEVLGHHRAALEETYDSLIRGGLSEPVESLWQRDGVPSVWLEIRRHARCIGGRWTIVVLMRDVTSRKEVESRIIYLNRVHAVLSGINALIVRVRERDELFRESCRIAVDQGALAMAWIGMVDADSNKLVPAASAGDIDELITAISRRLDANSVASPGNSVPTQVIGTKRAFVCNDSLNDPRVGFAHIQAKYGVRSFAILPLIVADEAVGVFALYANEAGFFHDEQLRLLTELASDIGYAIAQIKTRERLDYLAYYDVLTGLANRNLFLERVAQYVRISPGAKQKLALCLIDLERFKNVNDSLGRAAGDSLLRQMAVWLSSHADDESNVARIDADRFALVLPIVADEEEAARVLEKLVKGFSNHCFQLNDTAYRLAVKIGVAIYPDDGSDAESLFKHAEVALKKAKAAGDRYLFYAQKMTETVVIRLNLENQLRRALELDEYVLHYQPKIDVASGKLVGAEALIRWNDPRTGLVPPVRFISILEETGLIHEVGRWALNRAMEDYLRWRNAGLPAVRVAVNLSPPQLRHRDFVPEVQRIIGLGENAAAGLELEITESLIMQDVQLSIANLQALRVMGVRVAIDDFGTGFSSLSYLAKLPVDTVKIDRSFVQEMIKSKDALRLVSIIINLAHSLKLNIVAEGVETHRQLRLLRLLGCDEIQGFLVSKPLPAAAFEEKYLVAAYRYSSADRFSRGRS